MQVCYALWEDSWAEDAVERDPESRFTDPAKVTAIDHEGEYFDVPGPHGCEPSPQRTPLLYQAGSSDRGREFAARHAEAVFLSQPTESAVREYVTNLERRLDAHGRSPDSVAFFPGLVPVVGETETLAQAKYESYLDAIDVEGVLALLSGFVDMDLSELEPDQPLEHIETEAIQGVVNAFTTNDDRDWTVREMAEFAGLGTTSPVVVGTPEDVADTFEHWYRTLGVDGINVKEVVRPDTLRDFVDLVVPELRDRDVLADPEGETLRERISGQRGLPAGHPGQTGS